MSHLCIPGCRYRYGKRQRMREARVWWVDPPSYFTDGNYLAVAPLPAPCRCIVRHTANVSPLGAGGARGGGAADRLPAA